MESTLYGRKKKGESRFIVIAPHGIDDLYTGILAEKLGNLLDASIVINDSFMKPSNPLAEKNLSKIRDFNKLPWYSDKDSYIRTISCDGLQQFYQDLLEYTRHILIQSDNIPVLLYIHGLKDRGNIGIDIGIGVRLHEKCLTNAREYAEVFLSSENIAPGGSIIADIRRAIRLKNHWNTQLQKEKGYSVGIGEVYFTGRPEQLPQIHKNLGYHGESIQIEINKSLRENLDYIVNLLYDGLILHY